MKGKEKNVTEVRSIIHRLRAGQSKREIHKELGVHRTLIRELYRVAAIQGWLDPSLPLPSDEEISKHWRTKKEAQAHPLDPHRKQLEQWHKQQLSSTVIHQLLRGKCSCDVQSIRRYKKKHFPKPVEPVMVRSTEPGRDLEVDFGELGRFLDDNDQLRRVWLFSLRLRHSRLAYREIVLDQTISTFLMGHVHAFEYFGGVPKHCIPDNLKAAVNRYSIDNDMINRSYQSLAEHYGFVISPCLPYTPKHKGGVEGDVKYCKGSFLAYFLERWRQSNLGIPRVRDLVDALKEWEEEVANVRLIHGVGRTPLDLFESEEKQALSVLPINRWDPILWNKSTVRRDWRVMVDNAYYSVPYHLIGEEVLVAITTHSVRIFHQHKEVAYHDRAAKKWDYKRRIEHAPPLKEAVLQCSREGLLKLAEDIGSFTYQVAQTILSHPSVDKLRPVRCLLKLAETYSLERLERACERAYRYKQFSYSEVKNILVSNLDSQSVDIPSSSKIIRLPRMRFERDPGVYSSTNIHCRGKIFEEKLQKLHPCSQHGNAMLGTYEGLLADQLLQEEFKLENSGKIVLEGSQNRVETQKEEG